MTFAAISTYNYLHSRKFMSNTLIIRKTLIVLLAFNLVASVTAQEAISFKDLSFWQPNKAKNWQIAGGVKADLLKDHSMTASKGNGVLVNLPDAKNRANLVSVAEHGDAEIEFDFMMAKYSNSGFYLQGRYEIQLLDSWGRKTPAFNDCGGVFARRRFEPKEELFEGHAPLINACLAPGLWQHMEIVFRAPRFDASGKKTANARLVSVKLNGVLVQDNRELTGPTGGPISEQEASTGPIMIQGDHGEIAFRNLVITPVGNNPVKMSGLNYEVIYGSYRNYDEFAGKPSILKGSADALTWEVARKDNDFALTHRFNLEVPATGKYEIAMQLGGNAILKVNGNAVLPQQWKHSTQVRTVMVDLDKGTVPVELIYFKMDNWMAPIIKFSVKSPDASLAELHAFSSTLALVPSDPIYLDAKIPTVFRSFMDYYEGGAFQKRIVHPVSVGDPSGLHYTYDLDNGALAQAWKGNFLNTSPMWDNRGDGSAQPRGMLLPLGDKATLVTLGQLTDTSTTIAANMGYKTLGYDLEEGDLPDFRYQVLGARVKDRIRVMNNQYLSRTIELVEGTPTEPLFCRLAQGNSIVEIEKGLYAVDDFSYFIRVGKEVNPQIVQKNGRSILYLPITSAVNYDIVF